jgi:hypothetical protein
MPGGKIVRRGNQSDMGSWTEQEVNAYLNKFFGTKSADISTVCVADAKSNLRNGVSSAVRSEKNHPRYDLRIHQKRRRLTDTDGVAYKSAIDGLVKGEILRDDSASVIRAISFTQEKCPRGEEEQTVIELWEITDAVHDEKN